MKNNCNNLYYYEVYGLLVKSTIELSELVEINKIEKLHKTVEVNICMGEMTSDIVDAITKRRKSVNYEKGYMWFQVKNTAIYKIENGKNITIQPFEGTTLEEIKLYLLGSCLGIVLIEQGKVAIHGGSVEIGNKGIVFMGERGAGKSTLTSALRLKGNKLIADDISVIENEDGLKINHGYPRQKICEDVISRLKYNKNDYSTLIVDNKLKYIIPVENEFVSSSINLGGICFLKVEDVDDVEVVEIKGNEKIDILVKNIYRIEVLLSLGMQKEYFKQCIDILKKVPIYKIVRPRGQYTVDTQIKLIEDLFDNYKVI